ncbi:SPE2 S-adenosylmethionine decarboxylase proenzyme [Candida maltosa Xu316]|uniref:S-adenosylmethionine decarboxylase proenzyme n=1 Tax=Candida maltosa (strain Xu316) TaxID=1245528 RepID=M3HGD1_CANMX|nr:hypothetical protein G210_3441 [Candida maltosa Xu316]
MPPTQAIFNHELSTSLDSTHAFEGPEKLLEIWFTSPLKFDLRSIKYDSIVKILNLVHCEVLSKISNDQMDAYLLSESSLFIFQNKLILKTCGRTTLLSCLNLLFDTIAREINDSVSVQQVFYSRRSFFFPDQQLHVHSNWDSEVKILDSYFENGKSYIVGHNTNWHLYVAGEPAKNQPQDDSTLEIIMTKLSLASSKKFYSTRHPGDLANDESHDLGHDSGQEVLNKTGLNSLFKYKTEMSKTVDNEVHDGFAFTPCGFSSNSMNDNNYYTIHVTPEPGWSYASFETNMVAKDYKQIIDKCINVFQPGQFMVTFLTNSDVDQFECCLNDEYRIHHKEELDVGGYKLFFVEFVLN